MKLRFTRILLFCFLIAAAGLVQAQAQTHYPNGVEGIKGASLPPPGFYFRDYNYIYFADKFKEGPPKFELDAYVQAPRLIWITGDKLLGGYFGMDVIVPFAYQDLSVTGFSDSKFGMADIFVEPITLSWHMPKADYSFGYGFWAPTGEYSPTNPASLGKGFFTHMLTGGVTVYMDKDKTWSLSALNRYEFNLENKKAGYTPGQYWTLEYGLGKSLSKTIELGISGYYQAQTTKVTTSEAKDSVSGIGPEITFVCPKLGVSTSVRYMREMGASNRPEGNVFNIIFTKRLGNTP